MPSKTLIPKALTCLIRQILDVNLPHDEMLLFAFHADIRGMSWLISLRANAGVAERIAEYAGPIEHEELSHGNHHTPG